MFGVSYIVIEIEKPCTQNGKSKCKGRWEREQVLIQTETFWTLVLVNFGNLI